MYRFAEEPKHFGGGQARRLCSLVLRVEDVSVDLDEKRGTVDIQVRQDGAEYSSRIISEGTLRVLAVRHCHQPVDKGPIAFEEPENGVHPRRLELIADLLTSLALQQNRQVIVTTHSPLFCNAILKKCQVYPERIAMLNVRHGQRGGPLEATARTLFQERELADALTAPTEDGCFEALLLRGLVDE